MEDLLQVVRRGIHSMGNHHKDYRDQDMDMDWGRVQGSRTSWGMGRDRIGPLEMDI